MKNHKYGIEHLVEICVQKGIKNIVISPGSRNAPIIIAFSNHPKINCLSIVDERSAAFFALGMAQQSVETVAIACTSGSAALNYAPAIAEAFYQHIPLLVLTADRPKEWIDQADSQTIKQRYLYANYIKKSFELPQYYSNNDELWYADRIINEAIDHCQSPNPGPVHINLPFAEPLYDGYKHQRPKLKIIRNTKTINTLSQIELDTLVNTWNASTKKMIIVGMMNPNPELNRLLSIISSDPSLMILTENTSNLHHSDFNSCIDRTLAGIPEGEEAAFVPEILVSIGNQLISKKIKAFFRQHQPKEHWHIDESITFLDTFQSLTNNIQLKPETFFAQLNDRIVHQKSDFSGLWEKTYRQSLEKHQLFLSKCVYSDFTVFEMLLNAIPENSNLQLANSTPVRYAQLFNMRDDLTYNSNRGTSGIDGSLSTAAGAAFSSKKKTTVLLGDLSFFYDSNGLWNHYLSDELKIIVINNQGGGIFRFLNGPSDVKNFETFFETTHNFSAKGIADSFNIAYQSASDLESLKKELEFFYSPDHHKTGILEIFTPRELNAVILRDYFQFLQK